jgi:hypothetical protein
MNKELMNKEIYKNNPRIKMVDEEGNVLSPQAIDYIGINDEYFLDICNPYLSSNGFCQSCEDMYNKMFGSVGILIELRKLGDSHFHSYINWLDKKYLEEFVAKLKSADPSEYSDIFFEYSNKASKDFDEATKDFSKKHFREMFQSEDSFYYDDYDDDDDYDYEDDDYDEEEY